MVFGDKGNPDERICDHCEKIIPADEPVNRVVGYDDRICGDCLETFEKEHLEAITKSMDTFNDRLANIIAEDLRDKGLNEQAERLIEQIVKKNNVRNN